MLSLKHISILIAAVCLAACGSGSTGGESDAPSSTSTVKLNVYGGDNKFIVRFEAVENATSYTVYWSTDSSVSPDNYMGSAEFTAPGTYTITDSSISNGKTYYVIAVPNGTGQTSTYSPSKVTPGEIAMSVSGGDAKIIVNFGAAPGATSYTVYWSTNSSVSPTDNLGSVDYFSPGEYTITHSTIENGKTYYVVVYANGVSQALAEPIAVKVVPGWTKVVATGGDNKIVIEFNRLDGATSYDVYWSTSPAVSTSVFDGRKNFASPGTYELIDPTIVNGTTYYLIVYANGVNHNLAAAVSAMPSSTAPFKLNDTGIQYSGNYPNGNNTSCIGADTQDCHVGRDANTFLVKIGAGKAGFDFSKIDAATGAVLAAGAGSYGCVRDNLTGLTWEIKQSRTGVPNQGGMHHGDDKFTWYNPDSATNGGASGTENTGAANCYGYNSADSSSYCNTKAYISRVNAENWCGKNNWRLPTRLELMNIINYGEKSSGVNIDGDYFKNIVFLSFKTENSYYWSSSPATNPNKAWGVEFDYGFVNTQSKNTPKHIMLVHD